ncbi:MAG: HAD hydrolase family protein [Armatimonadota bacterium]|nr:HAD hydrolase family protein [Armatimonadota bacterium]MDW8026348.1 HAD hydrolase family protein [Armatimonadota bacterium]
MATCELAELHETLKRIKLLAMDVDGVLTTGQIVLLDDGSELKAFDAKDGVGLRLASIAGIKTAWVTARCSECVKRRAEEIGVDYVVMGRFDKVPMFEEILRAEGIGYDEAAFIGDDIQDIPLIKRCGFGVAVADAHEEVKRFAKYVTERPGGKGAVREVIELILKARGIWNEVVGELIGELIDDNER